MKPFFVRPRGGDGDDFDGIDGTSTARDKRKAKPTPMISEAVEAAVELMTDAEMRRVNGDSDAPVRALGAIMQRFPEEPDPDDCMRVGAVGLMMMKNMNAQIAIFGLGRIYLNEKGQVSYCKDNLSDCASDDDADKKMSDVEEESGAQGSAPTPHGAADAVGELKGKKKRQKIHRRAKADARAAARASTESAMDGEDRNIHRSSGSMTPAV